MAVESQHTFIRDKGPHWVTDIHNKAPPGSLNDLAACWHVYAVQQPEDTKSHQQPPGKRCGGKVLVAPSPSGGSFLVNHKDFAQSTTCPHLSTLSAPPSDLHTSSPALHPPVPALFFTRTRDPSQDERVSVIQGWRVGSGLMVRGTDGQWSKQLQLSSTASIPVQSKGLGNGVGGRY